MSEFACVDCGTPWPQNSYHVRFVHMRRDGVEFAYCADCAKTHKRAEPILPVRKPTTTPRVPRNMVSH